MKQVLFALIAAMTLAGCNNSSGWSAKDRSDIINSCTQTAAANMGEERAKDYCTCMQKKLEVKFPNPKDAAKITSETMQTSEMQALVRECLGGDNTLNNNTNNPIGNPSGNSNENNNSNGNWTQEQFQQYVQGCAGTAQQAQGMTPQQANAYCECMTKKVAAKYSFEVAARMTAADFQTEEWVNAANDCRAQVMGQQ